MIIQARFCTGERTTIDNDDASAGQRRAYELFNITANAGYTRHFSNLLPIKPNGQIIRHLSRARTTRTGIDNGFHFCEIGFD